jgi:hypothetical protein
MHRQTAYDDDISALECGNKVLIDISTKTFTAVPATQPEVAS